MMFGLSLDGIASINITYFKIKLVIMYNNSDIIELNIGVNYEFEGTKRNNEGKS